MSSSSGAALRTLICWPEPHAAQLAQTFRDQSVEIDLIQRVALDDLEDLLRQDTWETWDVLHIAPGDWRRLSKTLRESLGKRAALIVFGPQPAFAADQTHVRTGLSFSEELPVMDALSLLARLHQRLEQNDRLADIVADSSERLILIGETDRSLTTTSSSVSSLPRNDVNLQIGNMIVKGDRVQEKNVFHSLGNQENRITLSGHAVIEQIAGKDQINANSVRNDVADIRQIAGEDQSNVNRLEDATGQVQQGAHGSQTNRNIVTSSTTHKSCPKCGYGNEANAKFCSQCATPLLDHRPPTADDRQ